MDFADPHPPRVVQSAIAMEPIVAIDPKVMHGAPCFPGTRVTIVTFFDHVAAGYTVEQFLEQFPTVRREQVIRLLESVRDDVGRLAASA